MLKKWYSVTQSEVINLAEQIDECSLDDNFPSWQPIIDALGVLLFGKELITSQQANLNNLLREFKDVFNRAKQT